MRRRESIFANGVRVALKSFKRTQETPESLQLENIAAPDMADRATNESDRALELEYVTVSVS